MVPDPDRLGDADVRHLVPAHDHLLRRQRPVVVVQPQDGVLGVVVQVEGEGAAVVRGAAEVEDEVHHPDGLAAVEPEGVAPAEERPVLRDVDAVRRSFRVARKVQREGVHRSVQVFLEHHDGVEDLVDPVGG